MLLIAEMNFSICVGTQGNQTEHPAASLSPFTIEVGPDALRAAPSAVVPPELSGSQSRSPQQSTLRNQRDLDHHPAIGNLQSPAIGNHQPSVDSNVLASSSAPSLADAAGDGAAVVASAGGGGE